MNLNVGTTQTATFVYSTGGMVVAHSQKGDWARWLNGQNVIVNIVCYDNNIMMWGVSLNQSMGIYF
jgi:hypothetical protein